jgi:hypothetical protein
MDSAMLRRRVGENREKGRDFQRQVVGLEKQVREKVHWPNQRW